MNLAMVATAVLVGLITGGLAGRVMKGGGYGLKGDMILGLVGSVVGSSIFRWVAPEAGLVVFVVVALVGAALVIVGQRKFWPALA